mmetsp:Transcript_17543/g.15462  ORF Transcript_17543/g.15462 Transcript_17543/m.15462 type:complete len:135 (-) Transcript_17543:492-896(-)
MKNLNGFKCGYSNMNLIFGKKSDIYEASELFKYPFFKYILNFNPKSYMKNRLTLTEENIDEIKEMILSNTQSPIIDFYFVKSNTGMKSLQGLEFVLDKRNMQRAELLLSNFLKCTTEKDLKIFRNECISIYEDC